uniref:Ketoreductase (KR) domain-containing protein n=1 Tax=Chromera velia CCMP2878 TaxID=1169474 RepID=A0A0K6S9S4_9ALVE|eukprot:Cvel_8636.t2-p1 / transcript=Cvel_8636.t2 / gene=Cvel_8636 / organism=Chromera_velia_CCMP2878 / gene_product=hypothetical protein / transcript_product=hypothetical protein / location=Cvel_scaffold481:15710-16597(+) / protein_length=204 / sequence_SO=supercontig / SO=protein_coding / is_pseudo=false
MGSAGTRFAKDTTTPEERNAFCSKVVLVTGANSGVGFECCKQLAECGWGRIILACRNKERGERALQQLQQKTQKEVFELMILDAGRKESCVQVATELSPALDCLILNAGSLLKREEALKPSSDGFCTLAATHVLGPVILTDALMSAGKLSCNATILYVSSEAARGVRTLGVAPPVPPDNREILEKVMRGGTSRPSKRRFDRTDG